MRDFGHCISTILCIVHLWCAHHNRFSSSFHRTIRRSVCVCDDVCPRTRNAFKTQTYINSIKRKKHTHRTYHAIESTYGNSFCELLAESLHRSFCSFFCLFFILYSFYRFVISCSGWKLLYSSFVQSFLLAFCHHQREHIILCSRSDQYEVKVSVVD